MAGRAKERAGMNPRPPGETRLCLDCARWAASPETPARDCAHDRIVDLAGATPAEIAHLAETAERAARARAESRIVLGAMEDRAGYIVDDGRAFVLVPLPSNVIPFRRDVSRPRRASETRAGRTPGKVVPLDPGPYAPAS